MGTQRLSVCRFRLVLCSSVLDAHKKISQFKENKVALILDAKRRLIMVTIATGRLRHLLQIGQPFKHNFVYVKLSINQPLAEFAAG